ncbi:MAG: hypothetical protein HXL35_02245 [Prevotellaceae bacterium]|nr:hypothetical protein [Prevotellaceae bacterium]
MLQAFIHRSTAVSNAADGRHTYCQATAVRTADNRRTVNFTKETYLLCSLVLY